MTGPQGPRAVLVTGASSGLGRAAAHLLASAGTPLVLASRSAEALERTRQECVGRRVAARARSCPPTSRTAPPSTRLLERARDEHGGLRGVIHAAAVIAYGRFADVPAEVFDRVQVTNVLGTANVARSTLRLFAAQGGGALVVVGSVLGKMATPYLSSYGTSKWARRRVSCGPSRSRRARRPGCGSAWSRPAASTRPVYEQAGSYTGHAGHPPPPVYQPETVARELVAALDRDRRRPGRRVRQQAHGPRLPGPARRLRPAGRPDDAGAGPGPGRGRAAPGQRPRAAPARGGRPRPLAAPLGLTGAGDSP